MAVFLAAFMVSIGWAIGVKYGPAEGAAFAVTFFVLVGILYEAEAIKKELKKKNGSHL